MRLLASAFFGCHADVVSKFVVVVVSTLPELPHLSAPDEPVLVQAPLPALTD